MGDAVPGLGMDGCFSCCRRVGLEPLRLFWRQGINGYSRGSVLWGLRGIAIPVPASGSRGFCSPIDQWFLSTSEIVLGRYVDGILCFHGSSMSCTYILFPSPVQEEFLHSGPWRLPLEVTASCTLNSNHPPHLIIKDRFEFKRRRIGRSGISMSIIASINVLTPALFQPCSCTE